MARRTATIVLSAVAYDSAGMGNDESAYSGEDTVTVTGTAGSIASNTTWSCGAYMTGDVTVGSGVTLTISPGTKVWVATSDSQSGGVDVGKCEVIVNGTLTADGARTDTTMITFTSTAAAPDSNNWRGIRLRPGNTSNVLDNCIIKYAYTGLEAESATVTVDSCTIRDFSNDGIKAIASTVTITRDSLQIGSKGVRGVELTSGTTGTVDHNVITASSGGARYGVEVKDDAAPDIEYNRIDGPTYGIKVGGTSGPAIEHNHILNTTGNGIQCVGDVLPMVRYTTLDTLLGTGVTATDYAIPDLGASPDSGSNRIVPSQGYNYYVANLTEYTLPSGASLRMSCGRRR